MAVFPTSVTVDMGLGGRFDDVLVNEAFVKAAYSFQQLKSTTCRDLTGNGYALTYGGSGFTRGISTDLPDGSLALRFNGSGYLERAHALDLDLAGGSMDVVAYFKSSTNDATRRAIVQKRATNSSGNGYDVSLLSGKVRWALKVGGVSIFDLASATTVTDGNWKNVHCFYDPPTTTASIYINGVLDATTGTTNTDNVEVNCVFRVGMFTDGAGGFIGDIGKVMVGREGNTGLGALLQATRAWTDVTNDIRTEVQPLVAHYGINGTSVQDLVASPGYMTFWLDNSEGNSAATKGYYSPGHASCRSGFMLRVPVRLRVVSGGVTYYKFRGTLKRATPTPGVKGERYTEVYCVDWLDTLFRAPAAELPVQVAQTADSVMGMVIDGARRSPPAVTLQASVHTLPYAIDLGQGELEPLASEAVRITASTGSLLYQKGDTTQGGTLIYEPRETRQATSAISTTLSTQVALTANYADDRVVNLVRATYYPRRLDASSTQVLASLPGDVSAQTVPSGETVRLEAPYVDPAQKSARVGGTSMTCVATTDYTFNTAADGSGTDLTALITPTMEAFANTVRWTIENTSGYFAYITKLQTRGQAIYFDDPITVVEPPDGQSDSIREFDERPLSIDMPYMGSASGAREYARLIVALYESLSGSIPDSVTVVGNRSSAEMLQALATEVGDRVGVTETQTAVATGNGYYVQSVDLQLRKITGGAMVTSTFTLAPSWPESLIVAYTGAADGLHNLSYGGDLELVAAGDYTFAFNRTGDTVKLFGAGAGGGGGEGRADSSQTPGGGGGGGGAVQVAGLNVALSVTGYTGKVGASGAGGSGGAGATGGTTEFRVPAGTIHLQLPGGAGGGSGSGTTGGAGGTGAAAGTGSGNVAGTAGGSGGNNGANGNAGTNNASGAGGGGGGGSSGQGGNTGGNGLDQNGGASAGAGNAGNDAPGGGAKGGLLGSGSPGGGGAGAGGVLLAGGYRGGGGGGSAGATSSVGHGGDGGGGALVIRKV